MCSFLVLSWAVADGRDTCSSHISFCASFPCLVLGPNRKKEGGEKKHICFFYFEFSLSSEMDIDITQTTEGEEERQAENQYPLACKQCLASLLPASENSTSVLALFPIALCPYVHFRQSANDVKFCKA